MSEYSYKPYTQVELESMSNVVLIALAKRLNVHPKSTKEDTIKAILHFQVELERMLSQQSVEQPASEPPRYSVRLQRIMESKKQKGEI